MAHIKNYGVFTTAAGRLLEQVKENAALLPDVVTEVAALEGALSAVEDARTRQDSHKSEKQRATQDLKAALLRTQDAATRLQNAAKFKLGAESEKLVGFQVVPKRKHGSRKSAKLKAKEEELQKQENDLLKREVEVLKKEGPATAA